MTVSITPNMSQTPKVEAFFEPQTNTISYVVSDPDTKACAIIDSVMDIDYAAGRLTSDSADMLISKRPAHGICPFETDKLLGTTAKVTIEEDTVISWEMLS